MVDLRGVSLFQMHQRLRRELLSVVKAYDFEFEGAEITGRPVTFPDREKLRQGGGTFRQVCEALTTEEVDKVPDLFLPYLVASKFADQKVSGREVKQILCEEPVRAIVAPADDANATVDPTPAVALNRQKGGRRPLPQWEEMLIDTIKPIFVGDWKPTSVSEIVARMQQWLDTRGIENGFSDSSLKKRARKIFEEFVSEG